MLIFCPNVQYYYYYKKRIFFGHIINLSNTLYGCPIPVRTYYYYYNILYRVLVRTSGHIIIIINLYLLNFEFKGQYEYF